MLVLEQTTSYSREATITRWYEEVFPLAASYIQRRGGNLDDAKEIFQESIVDYYEKCLSKDFKPKDDDKAYLMGIVKNKWLKYFNRSTRKESLDLIEIMDEKVPIPVVKRLLGHLKHAGEKCMNLLQSYYYENLTMKQIADRFGYAGERSATVQKYKCIEKVREEVKRKSMSYEDFFE